MRKSKVAPITRPHAPVFANELAALYYIAGNNHPWHTLKYVRRKPYPGAHNSYWLSWNTEDKRFADSSSRRLFEAQDPVGYRGVVDLLTRRPDLMHRAILAAVPPADER